MAEQENEQIQCENCQCEIDDGSEQEQDGGVYCDDCYSELFAYCEHCDFLYRRVLEPLGYEYKFNPPRPDEASCSIEVRRKASP